MAVHVGSLLAGRYEITAPIASGGMGEVWQARDRTLGRTVAVKVLRSEYTGDSSFLIRFRNEARHTAALSHPNIASVYDYGETSQEGQRLAYLIMEFVEGKPLVTILAERGRLTPEQTLDVLGQAGDGLSAAHAAGMVHRDIKPGNLLVRPDGVVKLTDFGIAYARDAAPLTRTGMVVGTAQYLSPEQAQGHVVTPASDVYSLGVLGYECVAGARPFDGESQVAIALAQINRPPPPLPPTVPRSVRALIERALAKDPAARFADGGDFADAVRRVAAGGTVAPATAMTQMLAGDGVATAATRIVGPATAPRTMPPLHGSPVDDDGWTDEPVQDAEQRRRTRLIWAVGALTLLVLVAGGVALLLSGHGADDGTASSLTSSSAAAPSAVASSDGADGITFDVAGYVGKDADTVERELAAKGLQVGQEEASDEQLVAAARAFGEGTVVTADPPQGSLAPGDRVVLYVTGAAYTPGDGDATTEPPAPTSGPAPTSATSTAPDDGGATSGRNGGGNGGGSSGGASGGNSGGSSGGSGPTRTGATPPANTGTAPPASTGSAAPTDTPTATPTDTNANANADAGVGAAAVRDANDHR